MIDFAVAARRHWTDAEILFARERLASSDHLYGLAVECALKAALTHAGIIKKGQDPPENLRLHAGKLWNQYPSYVTGRLAGILTLPLAHNPFAEWDINQRYFHDRYFTSEITAAHKDAARQVMGWYQNLPDQNLDP